MSEKVTKPRAPKGDPLAPRRRPKSSPPKRGAGLAWKVEQLPKIQEPVSTRRSEDAPGYVECRFVLVTPKREQALREFAAKLKELCDRYHLNLLASDEGSFIEVVERGFRYPRGFEYSATMRDQRKINIERTWFDEARADAAPASGDGSIGCGEQGGTETVSGSRGLHRENPTTDAATLQLMDTKAEVAHAKQS